MSDEFRVALQQECKFVHAPRSMGAEIDHKIAHAIRLMSLTNAAHASCQFARQFVQQCRACGSEVTRQGLRVAR